MYHLIKKGKGHFSINLFKGELREETREGFGLQLFPNGCYYIGFWHNNEATGQGKLVLPDGTFYEGQYYKNIIQSGRIKFFNGSEYEGTFDGTVYERFSKGTFYFTQGDKLIGEWRDGLLVDGQLLDKEGKLTEFQKDGSIVKKKLDGIDNYGIIITKTNKWMYEGGIVQEKCNGKGIIYCTFQQYKHGFFENDMVNGYYKKVGLNWGEIMEGECVQDRKVGTWKKLINKGYLIERSNEDVNCRITFPYMNEDYFEGEIDNQQNESKPFYVKFKKGIYHQRGNDGDYKSIQISDIDNIMSIKEVKIRGLKFEFTFSKIFAQKDISKTGLRDYMKHLIERGFLKEKHLVGFFRRIYRPEEVSITDSVYSTNKSASHSQLKQITRSKSPIFAYANKMQKLKKSTNIDMSRTGQSYATNTRIFPESLPKRSSSIVKETDFKTQTAMKEQLPQEVKPTPSISSTEFDTSKNRIRKEPVKKSNTLEVKDEKMVNPILIKASSDVRDSKFPTQPKVFMKNSKPFVEETTVAETLKNELTRTIIEPSQEQVTPQEIFKLEIPANEEPRNTSTFNNMYDPIQIESEQKTPQIKQRSDSNEIVTSPIYRHRRDEVNTDKPKAEPIVKKIYEVEYFEGSLQKGKMTGFCKVLYADKNYKEGIFKGDKLNGPGSFILANGIELHGTFNNDVPSGPGQIVANKKIYKGEFEGESFYNPYITLNKNYSVLVGEELKVNKKIEGRCTIYLADEYRMEAKVKAEQFIVNERCRLYDGDKRYWIGKIREEMGKKVFDSLSSPKVKYLITENDKGISIVEIKQS